MTTEPLCSRAQDPGPVRARALDVPVSCLWAQSPLCPLLGRGWPLGHGTWHSGSWESSVPLDGASPRPAWPPWGMVFHPLRQDWHSPPCPPSAGFAQDLHLPPCEPGPSRVSPAARLCHLHPPGHSWGATRDPVCLSSGSSCAWCGQGPLPVSAPLLPALAFPTHPMGKGPGLLGVAGRPGVCSHVHTHTDPGP